MSDSVKEAARLMNVLPEADKVFAYEFIKVTAEEAKKLNVPKTAALSAKRKSIGKTSESMVNHSH